MAGWVVEHGETLIVPEANKIRASQAPGGRPGKVRSVIALPLRGRKGTHGAIEIFNPRADQMTDYTIAFLHILADHAAIAIENARDVARIQQLTFTDDTTGLYNVRHLYEVLGKELERSRRQKHPVSLAFLDLDRFKLVNDEHGHLVGSELLAKTGQRLQELSRKQDFCFRYGGDEFVILMPETSAKTALSLATELHHALMETKFPDEERTRVEGERQRGPGYRARRRCNASCCDRRRRFAHVSRQERWPRAREGRVAASKDLSLFATA